MSHIIFTQIKDPFYPSNCFLGIPQNPKNSMAIMTHGYTSSKSSILTWFKKILDNNIPAILFDLPGHYLGGAIEVQDFSHFKQYAPNLFLSAYKTLMDHLHLDQNKSLKNVITIGHSLGALLALLASERDFWREYNNYVVGVGLGLSYNKKGKNHILETDFYADTLNFRKALVSKELNPENIFPWIKGEKKQLELQGKNIGLIAGQNDLIVSETEFNDLANNLAEGNEVEIFRPKNLPHHQPDMAGPYIIKYLKLSGII